MNTNSTLKAKYVMTKVGDTDIAVPIGRGSFNGVLKLNETAKLVLQGLQDGLDVEEIASRLSEQFEVDEAKAESDVKRMLDRMVDLGIVRKE